MGYDELTLAQKALYDASTVHHTDCGPMLLLGFERARKTTPHAAFMDDDWKPVSRLLLKFYANRLAAENSPSRTGVVRKPDVRAPLPQARTVAQKMPATGVEARIRELSGERLVAVAKANRVNTEVHPTNAGITAMRRKNA